MPVQSKILAGRSKRPPPFPAPKPILKNAINAWESPTHSYTGFQQNSPVAPLTPSSPTLQVAVLRSPVTSRPPAILRSPITNGTTTRSPITNGPVTPSVNFATDSQKMVKLYNGFKENGDIEGTTNHGIENGDDGWSSSDAEGGEQQGASGGISKEMLNIAVRPKALILRQISGGDALRDCEDHTDWANEILSKNNRPLITDLRRSIGDGQTLPTLLEIISGTKLTCIKILPQTKEDRIYNLLNCLKFLCKRGVDISNIDPRDLENGNLKASLLLVGNIRKQFKKTYTPTQNGHKDHVETASGDNSSAPKLPPRNMPGAMKLPGAVPTPFLHNSSRDPSPRNRTSIPGSPRRRSAQEELLPGVLGREPIIENKKTHSALISTTELGTNGVAQHGVEERRQHLESTGTTNRGILVRHPNGKTGPPSAQQDGSIPQQVTRAWTTSPRLQQRTVTPVNGKVADNTVEDRLRQLLKSNNQSRDSLVNNGDGMFHGGGSEVFDDGEILVVPPPKSRNSPDFDMMMMGNNSYGPGYRHNGSQPSKTRGYVPSKPAEKLIGSRGEVLFNNNKNKPTIAVRNPRPQLVSQTTPGMTNGHENNAFIKDEHAGNPIFRGNNSLPNENLNKPPSVRKNPSNDLRNAWNKLYGRQISTPGQPLNRGDNLRSSYGPQSPSRGNFNSGQHSVKFAPSPTPQANRPVSAPAPAHMQNHFHTQDHQSGQSHTHSQDNLMNNGQVNINNSAQRASPMGQSANQGHIEDFSSSQQVRLSQGQMQGQGHAVFQPPFVNVGKTNNNMSGSLSSPNSDLSPSYEIGPSSKYPELGSRPSSAKKQQVNFRQISPRMEIQKNQNIDPSRRDFSKPPVNSGPHGSVRNKPPINITDNLSSSLQNASKIHHQRGFSYDGSHDNVVNKSHDRSHDNLHNKSHDSLINRSYSRDPSYDIAGQSIFDFDEIRSETSGSMTPPLPPLSPTNTPPDSPSLGGSPTLPRSASATNVSSAFHGQDIIDSVMKVNIDKRKPRRTSELQFSMERRHPGRRSGKNKGRSRGANLRNVYESDTENESNLSFDIDDTILTVESHDTENPHPAGDILTTSENLVLRQKLTDLQTRYQDLQVRVEPERHKGHGKGSNQGPGPPPIGRQRRWSIGSSDTSSFRQETRLKPGKHGHHKHHSKEFKNISKRFQRLESHVVTLARSVAHLSSELRTHNAMVNDLDNVKKELREIRDNPSRPWPPVLGSDLTESERFRGWVPSLTNPKRVNKLTKFFGTEPPLLEIFLKKLGYEQFAKNFQTEHIGMIELPYMTEDRLEKIGVPMGPRSRILKEAQLCFKQENYNIHMV